MALILGYFNQYNIFTPQTNTHPLEIPLFPRPIIILEFKIQNLLNLELLSFP